MSEEQAPHGECPYCHGALVPARVKYWVGEQGPEMLVLPLRPIDDESESSDGDDSKRT